MVTIFMLILKDLSQSKYTIQASINNNALNHYDCPGPCYKKPQSWEKIVGTFDTTRDASFPAI